MNRKYNTERMGLEGAMEELKERFVIKKVRMRYDQRKKCYRQNRLFKGVQKRFYKEKNRKCTEEKLIVDNIESETFLRDSKV